MSSAKDFDLNQNLDGEFFNFEDRNHKRRVVAHNGFRFIFRLINNESELKLQKEKKLGERLRVRYYDTSKYLFKQQIKNDALFYGLPKQELPKPGPSFVPRPEEQNNFSRSELASACKVGVSNSFYDSRKSPFKQSLSNLSLSSRFSFGGKSPAKKLLSTSYTSKRQNDSKKWFGRQWESTHDIAISKDEQDILRRVQETKLRDQTVEGWAMVGEENWSQFRTIDSDQEDENGDGRSERRPSDFQITRL